MNELQNLHTHTCWCDGKDTPEQMVRFAIEKGFTSLGFSGHSYNPYSGYAGISEARTAQCNAEVDRLKEVYRGQLEIFKGLEVELVSVGAIDLSGYDYLIGSVHYLKKGDAYVGFDRSAEEVRRILDTYYAGDGMKFAADYYEMLSALPQYGTFDIIGHFDLITKNIELLPFLDMDAPAYLELAFEAARSLQGKIPLFEVNTGAIARGYRTTPYPAIPILKELKRLGFGAVISSDCHDGRFLDCGFSLARECLKECGFREQYILTENGFRAIEIG